jgi:hypothetical protein
MKRRPSCPTPEKPKHKNLRSAEQAAHTFARQHVVYEEVKPLYAYECRCGRWHLTSHADGKHKSVLVLTIPPELQEWARTKVTS